LAGRYDETVYANDVAQRYRTRHHSERVKQTISTCWTHWPACTTSRSPTARHTTYRVCQLARKHVTVALSGTAVTNPSVVTALSLHLQRSACAPVCRWVCAGRCSVRWRAVSEGQLGRHGSLPRQGDLSEPGGATAWKGISTAWAVIGDAYGAAYTARRLRRELQGYQAIEVLRRHGPPGWRRRSACALWQYLDFKTYLPGDI